MTNMCHKNKFAIHFFNYVVSFSIIEQIYLNSKCLLQVLKNKTKNLILGFAEISKTCSISIRCFPVSKLYKFIKCIYNLIILGFRIVLLISTNLYTVKSNFAPHFS